MGALITRVPLLGAIPEAPRFVKTPIYCSTVESCMTVADVHRRCLGSHPASLDRSGP